MTHPLDIVRDNAELSGQWPASVSLGTVHLLHGKLGLHGQEDANAIIKDHARVGMALVGAERVGVEVVSANLSPSELDQLFDKINAIAAAAGQTRKIIAPDIRSGFEASLIGMIKGLMDSGQTEMPIFFPIDAYAKPLIGAWTKALKTSEAPLLQRAQEHTALYREREAIVVRQTFTEAQHMASDGMPHRLAIVQGCDHYRTSEAFKALGAKVETLLADQPVDSPLVRLENKVRDEGADTITDDDLSECESASLLGLALMEQAGGVSLLRSATHHKQSIEQEIISGQLEIACLYGMRGQLEPSLQQMFDDYANCVIVQNMGSAISIARRLYEALTASANSRDATI